MNMVMISLCAIVRNEEALLGRALESIRGSVDELIIVDTGSTDGTVSVAEGFGAKVYHHRWEGDFAKHRNQSIHHANGEWIFILDADEELEKGHGKYLRDAALATDIDSVMATTVNYFNNRSSKAFQCQVRMFRNNGAIHYDGIVHNQLKGFKKTKDSPIRIHHYGYDLGRGAKAKKYERTKDLLKQQIVTEPQNYFHHLNLAVIYATNFEFREAVREGQRAVQLAKEQGIKDQNLLWALYVISSAYYRLGNMGEAEKHALAALKMTSDHADSYFILCLVYHHQKEWGKLREAAARYIRLVDSFTTSQGSPINSMMNMLNEKWRVHLALGDLHIHEEDMPKAEQEFELAQTLSPDTAECARIIGDIYRSAKLWEKAARYYSLALAQGPIQAETLLGLAMVRRELGEFDEYKTLLDQLDVAAIEKPEAHFHIGLVRLNDGEYGPAVDSFARALRLDPDFYAAYVNMALAFKHRGQWQEAIAANLEAIKRRPDRPDARINLGNLYYQFEQFDLAKENYQKVLEQEPDNLAIRILLCEILVTQGYVHQCHRECIHVLKNLEVSYSDSFFDITELPLLLLRISEALQQRGQAALSRKTLSIGKQLNSKIDQVPIRLDRSSSKSCP